VRQSASPRSSGTPFSRLLASSYPDVSIQIFFEENDLKLWTTCLLLSLCVIFLCSGCATGPWRLAKSWDDKTTEWTSHNAWLHGALLSQWVPVYPIVGFFLGVADFVFVNPYFWWTHDAWTNEGTVYWHTQPTGPATVPSAFEHRASEWVPKP
jgi:hypothetical protein